MYFRLLYFVGAICHFYSVNTSKAPFIKKCLLTDSECMKKSAIAAVPIFVAGIPNLGVEVLDPLFLKTVDSKTPLMKMVLSNVTVTGIKSCNILSIKRDMKNSKMLISAECTNQVEGKYEADGKILFIEMKGRGNAHLTINKIQYDIDCNVEERKGSDGKIYFHLKNIKYTYKLNDKAKIEMDGLFDGNEILSYAVQELLKTSANEVVLEMGAPVLKVVTERVIDNVKRFFDAVPREDLVLCQ